MTMRTRGVFVPMMASAFAVFLLPAPCKAQAYTITTAAGGANPYFLSGTGDGGSATGAGLANPVSDVAVDGAGNLYIAAGTLIRKVDASGIISTVAGGGTALGDHVSATQAELSPLAIAVDSAGNLYIADSAFGVSRIRKVDTSGTITTVAGGAACCALGDAGPATSAYIGIPYGLAIDATGNLYIAQTAGGANVIRKVTPGGTISTVAGGGTAGLGEGGAATNATLSHPVGVAVDGSGNLYIADAGANRVRKVSAGIITTAAGSGAGSDSGDGGPASQAAINGPWHVAVDVSGTLFITQIADARVRLVSSGGTITTIAGTGTPGFSGDGGSATSAMLDRPAGLALGSHGTVYIADATYGIGRVRMLTPAASGNNSPIITDVENGASFVSGLVANAWITIKGSNFSSGIQDWSNAVINGKLPISLSAVSVSVNGQPAYIEAISPGQINAVAPDVPPGPVQVTVTTGAGTSVPFNTTAQIFMPAFFLWPGSYAVATHTDYTPAVKNGTFAGLTTVPAKPGDTIILWGSGFGPSNPAMPTGIALPSNTTYFAAQPVTVSLGTAFAQVIGAALAPGDASAYLVAIQVPISLADGDYPVVASVNGVQSPAATLLTVQH